MPAGGLVIKQVRQIPQPNDVPSITPFLINQPTEYNIFPGEYQFRSNTDVFADHRLKSRWTLQTKSTWLDEPNLAESFYTEATIEYLDDTNVVTITEDLPLLPLAWHDFNEDTAVDGWMMEEFSNPRTYLLQTENIPTLVSQAESPLFTIRDLGTQPFMLSESRFTVLNYRLDTISPSGHGQETSVHRLDRLQLWITNYTFGKFLRNPKKIYYSSIHTTRTEYQLLQNSTDHHLQRIMETGTIPPPLWLDGFKQL